jgi:cobaltochelatase CobT
MIREDLLKDNIDGEALLWAHGRLMARGERRRILLVISDGVPLDESTLSVNPGNYLEEHLRAVVHYIAAHSPVELRAIGIGHDVQYFYARSVKIDKAEELGGALMGQLTALFAESELPGRTAARGRATRDGAETVIQL